MHVYVYQSGGRHERSRQEIQPSLHDRSRSIVVKLVDSLRIRYDSQRPSHSKADLEAWDRNDMCGSVVSAKCPAAGGSVVPTLTRTTQICARNSNCGHSRVSMTRSQASAGWSDLDT